jgi:hypothetical protein
METKTPSKEHSALLTQAAYKLGEKGVKKSQRVENANKHVEATGYIVNAEHSNSEVTAYQHKDDPNNVFIAHRGTKVDTDRRNKNHNDITADLMTAVGLGGQDAKMRRRKEKTNSIVKALQPTSALHLGGHSLGGGTINHTIANSKKVRKHLTSAKTFNGAAHPIFSNGTAVSAKVAKELENKVEHHRIKNDPVSAGFLTGNVPFGKLKTHSIKHDPTKGRSFFQNMIEGSTAIGRAKVFTEKGIHAHAISHFHDGSIKKKKKKKNKK